MARTGGTTARNPKNRMGLGNAAQPQLGAQLTRRVSSGAITPEQAQRTAQQRRLLSRAYGPEWRKRVFGAPGKALRARLTMAEHPNAEMPQQNYQQMLAKRTAMLKRAKEMKPGEMMRKQMTRKAMVGNPPPQNKVRKARRA